MFTEGFLGTQPARQCARPAVRRRQSCGACQPPPWMSARRPGPDPLPAAWDTAGSPCVTKAAPRLRVSLQPQRHSDALPGSKGDQNNDQCPQSQPRLSSCPELTWWLRRDGSLSLHAGRSEGSSILLRPPPTPLPVLRTAAPSRACGPRSPWVDFLSPWLILLFPLLSSIVFPTPKPGGLWAQSSDFLSFTPGLLGDRIQHHSSEWY